MMLAALLSPYSKNPLKASDFLDLPKETKPHDVAKFAALVKGTNPDPSMEIERHVESGHATFKRPPD